MAQRKNNAPKNSFTVEQSDELLPFLLRMLPETGRNSVKSVLKRGQVLVEDEVQTRHDHKLQPGQKITIVKNKTFKRKAALTGLSILHEDEDLIVIDKSAGLLSIGSPKEKQETAHRQLMNYVKSKNPNHRIFVVHRLDRDTSGVMLFAKNEEAKLKLQQSWKKMVKERKYAALVEGSPKQPEGTVESYVKESKTLKMFTTKNPKGAQHAITHYKKVQGNANLTLLEVQLETGRKNQIRVHMQEIGHPIAGDNKYGARTNPIKRLGLHAHVLAFQHPSNKKVMRFESPIPKPFLSNSR
ncbi:RluA family pseudouridine synthase [Halobacillus sp. B29]|uniref:RluA family pseudouridine synthase n=1 Tax=Halobacillus sp. B29 TaxID=3457432 RepID=UPI003FCD5294